MSYERRIEYIVVGGGIDWIKDEVTSRPFQPVKGSVKVMCRRRRRKEETIFRALFDQLGLEGASYIPGPDLVTLCRAHYTIIKRSPARFVFNETRSFNWVCHVSTRERTTYLAGGDVSRGEGRKQFFKVIDL